MYLIPRTQILDLILFGEAGIGVKRLALDECGANDSDNLPLENIFADSERPQGFRPEALRERTPRRAAPPLVGGSSPLAERAAAGRSLAIWNRVVEMVAKMFSGAEARSMALSGAHENTI